jgi:hypothetical protein
MGRWDIWAEKIGANPICGMGETEQEILEVVQMVRGIGSRNHNVRALPGARLTD